MKAPVLNPAVNSALAKVGVAPKYIANFDSMSGMLRALSNFLKGSDFPGMGINPPAMEPLAAAINQLPEKVRELAYIYASGSEGIPADQLHQVSADAVAEWMVNMYPQREYPAVAIGSSNGALVNLCAALGIPWLPQTFLIPVAHNEVDADEPKQGLEFGLKHAGPLLEANPELKLHHMHDANQDRLTLQKVQYFRVKRLRMGEAFERFIEDHLVSNGTIFIVECQRTWPTTKISDRYIFQHGALGGATEDEFLHGSERVAAYLERYDSHVRQWDSPEPNGEEPEAEWGFDPALRHDIEDFARRRGYKVRRIVFYEPEHLSPFVADLYRWWYKERQMVANRLLIESFIFLEPYWALRTGSVPFWMKFNMQPSLEWIMQYLDGTDPYDEIYTMLFTHGVNAVGLPTIGEWRAVVDRARKRGEFIGISEDKFPLDLAAMIRYYNDLPRSIPARYPMPGFLTLEQLDHFIQISGDRYPVRWIDHPVHGNYEDEDAAMLRVGDRM
jgi:hypothetical protein